MSIKLKYQQPSAEIQEESLKIARATQRPGQTKEQTKLIAQGIQKGIDFYKKQQKAKARELDKKLKKVSAQLSQQPHEDDAEAVSEKHPMGRKQSILPWILLIMTWLGILGYFYFKD